MSARRLAVFALLLALPTTAARAQTWDASLQISPFPSPYLSDWESNPAIGTLTITNPTGADRNVLLAYRVTDRGGRLLASGRSDPVLIPRGAPTVITDFVSLPGSSQHDQGLEGQMRRTGRLPEGENTTCVVLTDAGGFVLAEDCATFSIVYPDPPYLIGPLDEAALASGYPIFQWTPMQVPPAFQLSYVVRVSEVLTGQTPAQAFLANIPVFETTTNGTSLEYPIGAPPLAEGKSYAWRIQALDQNGYAASSNDGRSEVWSFGIDDGLGGPEQPATASAVLMSVFNTVGAQSGSPETRTGAGDVSGLESICVGSWPPAAVPRGGGNPEIGIGVESPAGFIGARRMRASLQRSLVGSSRVWSLTGAGPGGRLVYQAYGDCDGPGTTGGRMHWIGVRSMAGASAQWLIGNAADSARAAADSAADQTSWALEFGVVFFSLYGSTTAGGTDAPAEVQAFLQGHEVEIEPGVTAYGLLHLPEDTPYWQWARGLGFTERRVELFGFLGLSTSLAVGGSVGSGGASADASMENKFLILRAGFPWRKPPDRGFLACGDPPSRFCVDSTRLELEISFGDSLRVSTDTSDTGSHGRATFELWGKLIHTVKLHNGITLTGMLALDFATELTPGSATERKLELVVSYGSDHQFDLPGGWWFGHGTLEFHHRLTGSSEQSLVLTFEVGQGDQAWGRLGGTVSRKWVPATDPTLQAHEDAAGTASTAADDLEARAREARRILDRAEVELRDGRQLLPLTEGDARLEVEGRIAQLVRQIPEYRSTAEEADARAEEARDAARSRATVANRFAGGSGRPSQWKYEWLVRVALGNLSLLDLVNVVRTAGGGQ